MLWKKNCFTFFCSLENFKAIFLRKFNIEQETRSHDIFRMRPKWQNVEKLIYRRNMSWISKNCELEMYIYLKLLVCLTKIK